MSSTHADGSPCDQVVGWSQFRRDVAALCERLSEGPQGGWVLLTEDAYAFVVGLFGLWHAGRYAVSPPNSQPGALRELQKTALGVLSDRSDWFPHAEVLDPLVASSSADPEKLTPLDPEAFALELYTSGTTGANKPVPKQIRHLEEEVRELMAIWDDRIGPARVFATASHQHLYGMLFGVLWPIASGRSFEAQHLLHMGELLPRMQAAGDCVLASVPTHLRRIAHHARAAELRSSCRTIFSSGGPLPIDVAHDVARAAGHAPVEVFGSTETGGIAFRSQQPGEGESLWAPFPRASLRCDPADGTLRVRSPFASVEVRGAEFVTSDRVVIQPDGRFSLLGRADRVVKVAAKRLDLAAMEPHLRGHPWVDEVALTTLDRDGEPRVAAAIVPSRAGTDAIEREGRGAFGAALRRRLAEDWDPVLHPRYWRVVATLPEDEQGKLTRAALDRLFAPGDWGTASADRPRVLEEFRASDSLERECIVPMDLACFAGHFPDRAIVPGVLQLDWAMELVAELHGAMPDVEAVESLKILRPLLPGDRFRIHVRDVSRQLVAIRLANEAGELTTGRIRLAREGRGA